MTTPKGAVYTFTYDTLGRLVKDENPVGGFKTLVRSDTVGRFTSTVATALGRTSVYRTEFLETGVVRRTRTDPAGLASVTTEAPDGAVAVTAADGMTLTSSAAADPRYGFQAPYTTALTVRTPAGLQSTITTTRAAVLTTALDPFSVTTLVDSTRVNGRLFTSTYDAATRTLTERTPLGRQNFTVVDANDRVTEERTTGLAKVSYTYDTRGRMLTSTQQGRTVTATYAANGRVATVTDPLGRSSSYAYDSAGRVLTTTLPGGRQVAFTYDRNGNLLSLTPPGRSAHGFSYTPADQTDAYAPPALSTGPTPTTFTYTLDQQLATVTRPDGVVLSLGYDAAGRPVSLTTPQGNLTFGYSATTGHLTSLASPGGVSQSFTYDGALPKTASWSGPVSGSVQLTHDADFRVTGLTVNAASNIAFGYDTDGLLASAGALSLTRAAGNGLLTGTTLGSLTTSWEYDSLALTTSSSALYGASSLFQTSYARDSLGRITTLTETIQGTTSTYAYTYDASGRLSEVRLGGVLVASYAYDPNGNRVSRTTSGGTETGSVDGQDRLLAYGAASYTYTANGELLTRIVGLDTTRYSYDVRGNLLSVRLPTGTLIAYVADGQNRRIQRSVNGVVTQGFLYQGQLAPLAELDASNQVVSRFVYATRVNVPDYLIKGGVTYRVLTDHLGSVRLVVNTSTGAVVQRLDYDEYGRLTQNTNPGFQPFGYAGGLLDDQTGLVRFGARDYDPTTGRWTAKDPIGFDGGDADLYVYVAGDPINTLDPTGLRGGLGDWLRGVGHAAGMTGDWLTGSGPANRDFGEGSVEVDNMRDAWRVNQAREYWYRSKKPGESLTNWSGKFGIEGLIRAGLDPTEQFVGSYRVEITPTGDGRIRIDVTNPTSMRSLLYGVGPAWERSFFGPGGTMRQRFTWTEPIRQRRGECW